MAEVSENMAGFVALPLQLEPSTTYSQSTTHYIYLKPHDPQVPEAHAPRSLFVVNIPITTSELHLRHLFTTQLAAGRVEWVEFSESSSNPKSNGSSQRTKSGRKRKRLTAEEEEIELKSYQLPHIWQGSLHKGGAQAVVVFVDRLSMEASLKAARRATKRATQIIWGKGLRGETTLMGLQRYSIHQQLQFPDRNELLQSVDSYMTAYSKMEDSRSREAARKRQVPDEEGFVTVTRGARGGVVRRADAKEIGDKEKEKNKGLEDFYRFQMREKRKEQQGELMRKFEADKRKVEDMRKRKGKLRVSIVLHY